MRKTKLWVVLSILVLGALACSTTAVDPTPEALPTPVPTLVSATSAAPVLPAPEQVIDPAVAENVLVQLYERVSPGVVAIQISTEGGVGAGSGFVIDEEGHIITNLHVVEGASDLEVDFPSGYKARGEVIGTDPDSDIAVILVDAPPEELHPLPLGDSNALRVGQTVVAIGNPFRLSGTMTVGIVSALGRMLESIRQAPEGNFFTAGDIIQTDAAINPGNSGGPLLNLNGEVIGINRAIRTGNTTPTGDPTNSGIGFAISINIVKRVVPVLIEAGSYDYPYLGISSQDQMSLDMLETLNLPRTTGAYVIEVTPDGPAEAGGLRGGDQPTDIPGLPAGGDLIVAADGQPVRSYGELVGFLMNYKSPGDPIVLTVLRDGEEMDLTVTLGKRP